MLQVDSGLKEYLEERIEKTEREKSKTGGIIKVKSRVIHHLQIKAEADGFAFISDEGERVGGYGAGPSPLRYFLAGIMMCHQVWCVKSAALLEVRMDSLEGEISGHLHPGGSYSRADSGSGLEKISYELRVAGPDSSEKVLSVVEKANKRCPAFGTIRRALPISLKVILNNKIISEKVISLET